MGKLSTPEWAAGQDYDKGDPVIVRQFRARPQNRDRLKWHLGNYDRGLEELLREVDHGKRRWPGMAGKMRADDSGATRNDPRWVSNWLLQNR